MNIIMDYNIKDYIDSITEVKPMVLDFFVVVEKF